MSGTSVSSKQPFLLFTTIPKEDIIILIKQRRKPKTMEVEETEQSPTVSKLQRQYLPAMLPVMESHAICAALGKRMRLH
jgi:hypothetical protein